MISKYFTVVHASGGQANFRSRDFMDQMSIKDTVRILYKELGQRRVCNMDCKNCTETLGIQSAKTLHQY